MRLLFATIFLSLVTYLAAQPDVSSTSASAPQPVEEAQQAMSKTDAVILGIVEGITEFLPISSTGHLIITNTALGLDNDAQLVDADGQLLWAEAPSAENPAGEPLTLKLAADTYIVVIQVGAIAAVVFIFWPSLMLMLQGVRGQSREGLLLLRNIALAFFPVVIVGLAFDDWIDANLFSIWTVIAALVVGAGFMVFAERWRKKHLPASAPAAAAEKRPCDLSPREAVQVGCVQCLALWPGMSRSMVTMVGGYFCGLAPARAAEFSFLVGLPVLGGAALYKGLKAGPAMVAVFGWSEMLIGGLVAAVAAAAAVRFLVAYLQKFGLGAFAIYRVVLAIVLALWMLD
ncbi:undecaprenyl-diphosphate phosphatase [Actomonas aquatica]|uniref:Undecaprenyl-diphosphatase n=1 Tax=Actomonas aquatica TaxID=2866162 RepID=A0ABZ1C8M7_9BACT|nr:undecaprenyl-diphosphate phosphatase [Opitutus sp. WL0086]WRQ87934.1 undecaprenyl-diphosphate phosphatase [Opitutus sp. WL0086]